MSGAITKLVAIGAQDVYLVGDPQVSFFRSNFKRHTNFTQQVSELTIEGRPAANGMSGVRIEKKGDLLSYMYLTAMDNADNVSANWANVIDKIDLFIGGQQIDSQDFSYSSNIAPQTVASSASRSVLGPGPTGANTTTVFYPLKFFFAENWSSALPLCALQYQDVELKIYWGTNIGTSRYQLWSNFMYLDDDERSNLAQNPQDMLVTQVQKSLTNGIARPALNFNHPVKFLASTDDALYALDNKIKMVFNGVDMDIPKNGSPHFSNVAQYYHSPNWVGHPTLALGQTDMFLNSFALDTCKYQPTGTLNFSRLDSAEINSVGIISNPVYAVNYNILRVQKGMAGLMYAN